MSQGQERERKVERRRLERLALFKAMTLRELLAHCRRVLARRQGRVCDQCGKWAAEQHFYRDRATGGISHEADPALRAEAAERCGWCFDNDYGTVERCRLPQGDHVDHVGHLRHWRENEYWSIPPAELKVIEL